MLVKPEVVDRRLDRLVADAVVSALGRELGGRPQRLDALAGDARDIVGDGAQLLYDTGLRRGELSLVDPLGLEVSAGGQ